MRKPPPLTIIPPGAHRHCNMQPTTKDPGPTDKAIGHCPHCGAPIIQAQSGWTWRTCRFYPATYKRGPYRAADGKVYWSNHVDKMQNPVTIAPLPAWLDPTHTEWYLEDDDE